MTMQENLLGMEEYEMTIREDLLSMKEDEYAAFQVKLTPGISLETTLGIRVPKLRDYAKKIQGTKEAEKFLHMLPHEYYDENMLHSILLSTMKDYDQCLSLTKEFLPYIDNWAVCDTLRPKSFAKHKEELLPIICEWMKSDATYTCRFGVDMLMTYYLDEDFRPEYLELPAAIESDEYYIKMMVAWYYATALAKQWDATLPYIEEHRLCDWTHRKTIQKAVESYRVSDEHKELLKTFR